jgi:5-methylcytosine-specific restriction protein A
MPRSAPRPCSYPGCGALVHGGSRCPKHVQLDRRQSDAQRDPDRKRLYGYRWQKASKLYLSEHPLCESDGCSEQGRVRAATVVDHRIPHRGDLDLFWDRSNWCAMAKPCHDRKTAREDGGFGNRAAGGAEGAGTA